LRRHGLTRLSGDELGFPTTKLYVIAGRYSQASKVDLLERIVRRRTRRVENCLVVDRDALNPAVHLPEPVGREGLFKQLLDVLDPLFEESLPPNAYVWGPSGAGKTAIVTTLLSALEQELTDRQPPEDLPFPIPETQVHVPGYAHDALAVLFVAALDAGADGVVRLRDENVEAGIGAVPKDGVSVARVLGLPDNERRVLRQLLETSADGDLPVHDAADRVAARTDLTSSTVTRLLYELSQRDVLWRQEVSGATRWSAGPPAPSPRTSPRGCSRASMAIDTVGYTYVKISGTPGADTAHTLL
jgi:hypothetical protein